jgi:hypothetical protein
MNIPTRAGLEAAAANHHGVFGDKRMGATSRDGLARNGRRGSHVPADTDRRANVIE